MLLYILLSVEIRDPKVLAAFKKLSLCYLLYKPTQISGVQRKSSIVAVMMTQFFVGCIFRKFIFTEALANELPNMGLPGRQNLREPPTTLLPYIRPSQCPYKAKSEKYIVPAAVMLAARGSIITMVMLMTVITVIMHNRRWHSSYECMCSMPYLHVFVIFVARSFHA